MLRDARARLLVRMLQRTLELGEPVLEGLESLCMLLLLLAL